MDKANAKARIEELRALIEKANHDYYDLHQPTVGDRDYDMWERELLKLESDFPEFATADSPVRNVAGGLLEGFAKVKHDPPMQSLDKTHAKAETGILLSCSDYHIVKKMKMSRSQCMDYYLGTVKDAFNAGVIPRCHLEDITRADFYGFVVPFVNELQKLSREAGIPVKIRACDTMGYGVPYTEAAMPRSVAGIIYGLQHYSDVPSECLEWHGHNDFYKAVANASTAWLYGACAVNCSLLGIGERTGNVPLEAMVFEYASLRGSLDGMDTTVITEIADFFQKDVGYAIPPMTPFTGSAFNVTRAGVHADGLMKDEEIYTIFDTKKILNRPATVQISKTSGLAGIAYWINQTYGLEEEKKLDKKSPLVIALKQWVDEQYEDGRQTAMTDRELEEKIAELAPELKKN